MTKIKRRVRRTVVLWLVKFFTLAIRNAVAWEMAMAKQDDCKHEGQTGVYCGLCGKAIQDPDEVELENVVGKAVTKVLTEHGLIKPKKPAGTPSDDAPRGNLAERLMKKKAGK